MQKVLNVMSVFSFVVSVGVVAASVYVYTNQEEIKEGIKQQVIEAATSGVKDSLPGFLGGGSSDDSSSTTFPAPIPGISF